MTDTLCAAGGWCILPVGHKPVHEVLPVSDKQVHTASPEFAKAYYEKTKGQIPTGTGWPA